MRSSRSSERLDSLRGLGGVTKRIGEQVGERSGRALQEQRPACQWQDIQEGRPLAGEAFPAMLGASQGRGRGSEPPRPSRRFRVALRALPGPLTGSSPCGGRTAARRARSVLERDRSPEFGQMCCVTAHILPAGAPARPPQGRRTAAPVAASWSYQPIRRLRRPLERREGSRAAKDAEGLSWAICGAAGGISWR